MNKLTKIGLISLLALSSTACSIIETGEVGVRRGFDNQIQNEELLPGSFNQILFGDVMHFPVKDVQVTVNNLTPLASDNSTISDFDIAIVYSINPGSVAEIYIEKNRGFHADTETGETLLMYNYMKQLGRNAVYKTARQYEALKMADNRAELEMKILNEVVKQLKAEKLDTAIDVSQVLVRAIVPAKAITQSANALVKAQNELKQKQVEVQTAQLEAERIGALNANAGATKYMEATALVTIAEAVKEGKVKTIIVPYDFKGIVNAN